MKTFLVCAARSGTDWLSYKAASHWIGEGPKLFRPTKEQCESLEHVEVNLTTDEYKQPYPAIMVEFDYSPFKSCLCYYENTGIICNLFSEDNLNDIVVTVGRHASSIESVLASFGPDCEKEAPVAHKALRVAVNCCLALAHYGCHLDYLFPKEVENDRKFAKEKSERGERARSRIPLAVQKISFDQEIKLHRKEDTTHRGNDTPAYSVTTHWRKGHWAMQPYGEKNQLRKRIFRAPVLVRADLFTGDKAETQTTYKG